MASQLGINLDGSIYTRAQGIGGVVEEGLIEVDSLRLGDAEIRNLDIHIGVGFAGGNGLLGATFLSEFQVDIKSLLSQR